MKMLRFFIKPLLCIFALTIVAMSCKKDEEKEDDKSSRVSVSGTANGHDYVDLGLPSGTKWATCNIGAAKPDGGGDFFTWGETVPLSEFTNENSKWDTLSYSELFTKGVVDANGNLTAQYDAATVNWGSDWRMPTEEEMEELRSLKIESTEVNGVKGIKFIGNNGNFLFIPFTYNLFPDEKDTIAGRSFSCWSATTSKIGKNPCCLHFFMSVVVADYSLERCAGLSIRPVLNKKK